jgi:hypothetical protein
MLTVGAGLATLLTGHRLALPRQLAPQCAAAEMRQLLLLVRRWGHWVRIIHNGTAAQTRGWLERPCRRAHRGRGFVSGLARQTPIDFLT